MLDCLQLLTKSVRRVKIQQIQVTNNRQGAKYILHSDLAVLLFNVSM